MKQRVFVLIATTAVALSGFELTGCSEQQDTPLMGRTDPGSYFESSECHGGPGTLWYMSLLGEGDRAIFSSNLLFIHRGFMEPESGIGEHVHRGMEEMYITLDGPVEHTVNGRTSLLVPGSLVLCPMRSSHGMYNPSDRRVNYLNVGVTKTKGQYDAVNFNEDLVGAKLESPAPFQWAGLDRRLMHEAPHAHEGKGSILFRRLYDKESFQTPWEFVDHCILPPGTSIGYHQHNGIEEVYYLVSGSGRMTVNDTTWDVCAGDAVPCTLHDSHGLYNNSDEEIELIVIAVAMEKGIHKVVNWGDDLSGR